MTDTLAQNSSETITVHMHDAACAASVEQYLHNTNGSIAIVEHHEAYDATQFANYSLVILLLPSTSSADAINTATDAHATFSGHLRTLSMPFRLEQLHTIILSFQKLSQHAEVPVELCEKVTFDVQNRCLRNSKPQMIELTDKETDLLRHLLDASNTPTTKDQLLHQVWGYDDSIDTHTLETHIYRLRGKLEEAGCGQTILSENNGYRLATL